MNVGSGLKHEHEGNSQNKAGVQLLTKKSASELYVNRAVSAAKKKTRS